MVLLYPKMDGSFATLSVVLPPEYGHSRSMSKALLLIDLQNDYFPGGHFPLWNTDATLATIEEAIRRARAHGVHVIHVQHIARGGLAPFFNEGTPGAEIHPRVLAAAPTDPVIIKAFADSFWETNLEETLRARGVTELLVAGMMTQNCVTHTALSKTAEPYAVTILTDATTTVTELLHLIALHACSTRVKLSTVAEALG
jgi:nicotinamidase-related amidase